MRKRIRQAPLLCSFVTFLFLPFLSFLSFVSSFLANKKTKKYQKQQNKGLSSSCQPFCVLLNAEVQREKKKGVKRKEVKKKRSQKERGRLVCTKNNKTRGLSSSCQPFCLLLKAEATLYIGISCPTITLDSLSSIGSKLKN